MTDFPKKGFSSSDPDDEIDLEALVQKTPTPPPQKKAEPLPPQQEKPFRPPQDEEEFDLAGASKAQKKAEAQPKPVTPKPQPPVETVKKFKDAPPESYIVDAETEFDHPVPRKKVRILPEFPTLMLIVIVSIVTAVITGIIVRYTIPSLQSKVAEVYSNQENTAVKVNDLEQSVSKLIEDVKALQEKAKAQPAAPAPVKKVKAKPRASAAPEPGPGLQGESPAPASEGTGTE
jgi:hypothetical protein